MSFETKKITFSILTQIIFGEGFDKKLGKIEMEDLKTGALNSYDFFEAFHKMREDCTKAVLNPLGILFPKIVDYQWGKKIKANTRNSQRVFTALSEYFSSSEDENSMYSELTKEGVASPEEAI